MVSLQSMLGCDLGHIIIEIHLPLWMTSSMAHRMLIESIKRDPAWKNGDYQTQPPALQTANIMFSIATTGGTLAYQSKAPTRELADKMVDARLAAPVTNDANDFIYIWNSSADYNAMPGLERIKAPMLVINSADDERNPVEIGSLEPALKKVKQASLFLIPASTETSGHATMMSARFYRTALGETASSMEQILSTVSNNEDNTRKANDLAQKASAARGGGVVSEVVDTMRTIQRSSAKISDIVGVIDCIAFQTNLLALNAAV